MAKTILLADAIRFITSETHGKVFGITYKKKDGTLRKASAKYGVKSRLTTGERTYEFEKCGLIPYFDMNAIDHNGLMGAYRCFVAKNLVSVKIDGEVYEVIHK